MELKVNPETFTCFRREGSVQNADLKSTCLTPQGRQKNT